MLTDSKLCAVNMTSRRTGNRNIRLDLGFFFKGKFWNSGKNEMYILVSLALKEVAFIAGKSENQLAKNIFIHFFIDNLIANISLSALSWPKLNFGCYFTFEIIFKELKLPFLCKLQDLTDSAIPIPSDFVIVFTFNEKVFGCLV